MSQADAVVLLMGERYGYPQQSGLSATHEEYREARDTRPVLAFVQDSVDRDAPQAALLREVQGWEQRALHRVVLQRRRPPRQGDPGPTRLHIHCRSRPVAKLTEPTPAGVAAREALVEAIEFKNTEFNAQGTELNQRCTSSAIAADPEAGDEVLVRDKGLYLQATTRPGAKLQHVWLVDDSGHKVSTLDVTGRGRFSLITGLAGGAWATAADKLDLPFLRTVVIGASTAKDSYHDWYRAREMYEAGAILVRPDGYIAWRHVTPIWDEEEAIHQLQSAINAVLDL